MRRGRLGYPRGPAVLVGVGPAFPHHFPTVWHGGKVVAAVTQLT